MKSLYLISSTECFVQSLSGSVLNYLVVEIRAPLPLFPIAKLVVDLGMASLAEGHEIAELVGSASR